MKALLISLYLLAGTIALAAQPSIIWQEDFSDGLTGWTFASERCEHFSSPLKGSWRVVDGQQGGQSIPTDLEAVLHFVSPLEFSLQWQWGDLRAEAQGQYRLQEGRSQAEADLLLTSLLGQAPDPGPIQYQFVGRQTLWAARLDTGLTPLPFWGRLLLGLDSLIIEVDGNAMQLQRTDLDAALQLERIAACPALWLWQPKGEARMGIFSFPGSVRQMDSPTSNSGVALLHADFLHTQGDLANNGTLPFPFLRSHLISPPIDLHQQTERLALRFFQHTWIGTAAPEGPQGPAEKPLLTSFSFSRDNGQNWSSPIPLDLELEPADTLRTRESWLPLPDDILGEDSVRFRFTWSGDLFYWMLDDISLEIRPGRDLALNPLFVARSPNRQYPRSQFAPFALLADLQNIGQDTARQIALTFDLSPEAQPQLVRYADTLFLDRLLPGQTAENQLFASPVPALDLPAGTYRARYRLSSDLPDAREQDNTYAFKITLSDSLFAKEEATTRFIGPAGGGDFTYGNCFYVPWGNEYYARTMRFGILLQQPLPFPLTLETLLLEWDGDLNKDLKINPQEYRLIAVNALELSPGLVGERFFTVPVDISGQGVPLRDGHYYVALVQYTAESDLPLFFSASGRDDFLASYFANDSLQQGRYASALLLGLPGADPEYDLVAFGFDVVPRVRLSIGDNPDLSNPAVVSLRDIPAERTLPVFPNPAHRHLRAVIPQPLAGKSLECRVFDAAGRETARQSLRQDAGQLLIVPLDGLPAGPYSLMLYASETGSIYRASFLKGSVDR